MLFAHRYILNCGALLAHDACYDNGEFVSNDELQKIQRIAWSRAETSFSDWGAYSTETRVQD